MKDTKTDPETVDWGCLNSPKNAFGISIKVSNYFQHHSSCPWRLQMHLIEGITGCGRNDGIHRKGYRSVDHQDRPSKCK